MHNFSLINSRNAIEITVFLISSCLRFLIHRKRRLNYAHYSLIPNHIPNRYCINRVCKSSIPTYTHGYNLASRRDQERPIIDWLVVIADTVYSRVCNYLIRNNRAFSFHFFQIFVIARLVALSNLVFFAFLLHLLHLHYLLLDAFYRLD